MGDDRDARGGERGRRRTAHFWAVPTTAAVAAVALWASGTWARLLDPTGFPARWSCGTWSASLGWTHVLADLATFGAYATIPLVLLLFVRRRPDLPFPSVFWLFAAFILACGTGHLVEAIIFWEPVYRLAGAVKVVTALVSWGTVIALAPVIPRALAMPGLQSLNANLTHEVDCRRAAEEQLRRRNTELEEFQRLAVDRELQMIELKRQVNELHRLLRLAPPYDVSFVSDRNAGSARAGDH
jgi:hypothetical protein